MNIIELKDAIIKKELKLNVLLDGLHGHIIKMEQKLKRQKIIQ
jgi:hypothetical protein